MSPMGGRSFNFGGGPGWQGRMAGSILARMFGRRNGQGPGFGQGMPNGGRPGSAAVMPGGGQVSGMALAPGQGNTGSPGGYTGGDPSMAPTGMRAQPVDDTGAPLEGGTGDAAGTQGYDGGGYRDDNADGGRGGMFDRAGGRMATMPTIGGGQIPGGDQMNGGRSPAGMPPGGAPGNGMGGPTGPVDDTGSPMMSPGRGPGMRGGGGRTQQLMRMIQAMMRGRGGGGGLGMGGYF